MADQGRTDRLAAAVRSAARRALDRGEWDEAAALARELLVDDPDDAVAAGILDAADHRGATGDTGQGRRFLTVLFSDVVGSTPLSQRLDPEDYLVAIAAYQDVVRTAVAAHGGYLEQFQGDGVVAYFGYPVADEDDQIRAVEAGLEIVQRVGLAEEHAGVELAARVGIHLGRTVLTSPGFGTRHRSAAIGFAANVAARLQGIAKPGTVVVSEAVAEAASQYFELEPLGTPELRGVDEEMRVFEVRSLRARSTTADHRLATPLVDRVAERAAIDGAWAAAVARSDSERRILLMGDPGMGKSRLARYATDLARIDAANLIEINCGRGLRHVGLGAVRSGLEKALGLPPGVTGASPAVSAAIRERAELVGLTATSGEVLEALLGETPAAGTVPELAPSLLREALISALIEWITAEARMAPTLLVVEDLHWADDTAIETIRRLTSRPLPPGLAVVLTSRTGGLPLALRARAAGALLVGPLDEGDTRRMAEALAGSRLDPDAIHALADRSEGVPLFTEHLVMATTTTTVARAVGDDLPETIEALLQTRLDATGSGRGVAEVAAVIGREFSVDVVEAALVHLGPRSPVAPESARTALRLLERAGLVERESTGHMRFCHSLVRDVAYAIQLRSERPHRHRAVAAAHIERRGSDAAPETLAYHHEQAGEVEPAAAAHIRAAVNASQLAEYDLALTHLRNSARLVEGVPTSSARRLELDAYMQIGAVYAASFSYAQPEAADAYRRALELCDIITADQGRDDGLEAQLAAALGGLWSKEIVAGDLPAAIRVTDRLDRLLARSSELELEVRRFTLGCRGLELMYLGDTTAAAATLHQASRLGRAGPMPISLGTPHDYVAVTDAVLAVALTLTGDDAGASTALERAFTRARDLPFPVGPFSVAVVQVYAAYLHRLRGDTDAARTAAQEVCDLGAKHGFQEHSMVGQILSLVAAALEGDEPACQTLDATLGVWRMAGGGLAVPVLLTELADGCLVIGDVDRAQAALDEAAAMVELTEQRGSESEVLRLRAELDARCGASDQSVLKGLVAAAELALDQGAVRLAGRALHGVRRRTGDELPAVTADVGRRFVASVPPTAAGDLREIEGWVSARV
ncbi:MAG: adenylate/guanylate cyclase domain-containing protein [Acidimicrobiales bacterium]|nr:adenylate/guanylate cyclase domain-containing protein [Acidimicrobiales bacterium]